MKSKNVWWYHCYLGRINDYVIICTLIKGFHTRVFLWNNGTVATHLQLYIFIKYWHGGFLSSLQDWAHSAWTPHDSEEPLHHKMEQTLYKKTRLLSTKVHILLLCLFVLSIEHDAWKPRQRLTCCLHYWLVGLRKTSLRLLSTSTALNWQR